MIYYNSMIDNIIINVLDKISSACETLKECVKNRKLPEACYSEKARSEEVKKWANDKKRKHK
tara:strand:- start:444 stop:629 length:186 start_codon:yes stop_codon:yes gene_type:complete